MDLKRKRSSDERMLWGFNFSFWVLIVGTFINTAGSALVFPFIALYISRRYGASELDIGWVFTIYAGVQLISSVAGGALTDRFGRKVVMVVGLIAAIIFSLGVAFASTLTIVLFFIILVGPISSIFGPASNAVVADMLPEEQHTRGYGAIRVASNLGVVIGPILGGLVADQMGGFTWLFVGDAVTSAIFALLIWFMLPETKPESVPAEKDEAKPAGSWRDTLKLLDGYGIILRDVPFMLFSLVFLLSNIIYSQMNTQLAPYLDREFSIPAQQYSLLISLNAAMVVLFQFPLTAYIERFNRNRLLAFGTLCYGIGFGMFGSVGQIWWFALGMAILTVGEMILVPVAQAAVAEMSPEDMRGRYMGIYNLTWGLSYGIGPLLGGAILASSDNSRLLGGDFLTISSGSRRVLWQLALIGGVLGAAAFLVMGRYLKKRAAKIKWSELSQRYGKGANELSPAGVAAVEGASVIPGTIQEDTINTL